MGKNLTAAFILLVIYLPLFAQQQLPAGQNFYADGREGIVYNRELSFDFKLVTPRSFALGVNFGQLKTYYRTRLYNIEIGDLRHSREFRQSFDIQLPNTNTVSNPFIFGKQNQLYVLRASIGEKRYLSEKARRKGLAVGFSYFAGPAIGFLKPYYLNLIYYNDQGPRPIIRPERYSPNNGDTFLDIYNVYGAAPWSKGLGEVKLLPGLHAKAAAHFDWGAFDELVKAIEAGVMVDFFFRDAPIMVESPQTPGVKNTPVFVNFFLNLQLGKRR